MRYRVVNGVVPERIVTEQEAEAAYDYAWRTPWHGVRGAFGKTFTTFVYGRNGVDRVLPVGETTYIPIHDE